MHRERDALAAAGRVARDGNAVKNLRLGGRIAGRLLGALLLAAGLAKAMGPAEFGQQVAAYKIITHPALVGMLAYAFIVVECGLGGALLANFKPKLMLSLALVLLTVFLVAVGYAWHLGTLEDCGCLPWMKRTPGEAFVEDMLLIAAAGWALWGHIGRVASENKVKLAVVTVALAAGLIVPGVMGLAGPKIGAGGVEGSTAFRSMKIEDAPADLSTGEYLVMLMSTECTHCQDAVPQVNLLANDGRLPKLIAVASEDRAPRGLFREDYKAQFPIAQISEADRRSLLKDQFPRFFLVRDGAIVAVWDAVPTADDVIAKRR